MRNDSLDGRRLRFPLEVGAQESIPGVIVRGVRQHVLFRTAPVLEASGVDLRHVGLSQLATPEELQRLAYVARCPANDLIERAGERLITRDDDKSYDARFGSLVIPRAYVEFNRRRIGPKTLEREEYHRSSWMNLLLPYCPESLERLVDECGGCGFKLGWFHTHGVGHCDRCGIQVEASAEPAMPAHLADGYRLFTLLSSPDPRGVEIAREAMPAGLAHLSTASLLRLALLVGGVVQDEPAVTSNRHTVTRLPPPVLASCVSMGAELLRSWPSGFQDWVTRRSSERRASPSDLMELRSRLQRFVDRRQEPAELVAIVREALPDLMQHAAHSFRTGRRYYLYKDVTAILGLTSPTMKAFKAWPGLRFQRLNTAAKEQGQFDAEQIDDLVPVFRDSTFMTSCAWSYALPLYAIRQLCAAGILEWEDHPALLSTHPAPKVRGSSIRRLTGELLRKVRRDKMPDDCVSITIASRHVGGRLKPWASIVDALRGKRIPFWMPTDEPKISSCRVRPEDFRRFQAIVDAEVPAGLLHEATVSQSDAAEILNLAPKHLPALCEQLDIPYERVGLGNYAPRDAVLAAAEKLVFSAEIALHLNVDHRQVEKILALGGVAPLLSGWSRRDLSERGMIPKLPSAGR